MASFKSQCEEFFGTTDLYEVLGVNTTASAKEIKKAYHRLSLLVHPDRVADPEKTISTEKFKVLGRIHSILQDKEKRKFYDDFGDVDDENDSTFNWMEYWRAIFKQIDIEDIKKHEQEYIGSETELRDIKKAYVNTKGNMDLLLEMVPFSNCDSEPRFLEIVRTMVDAGEVEEYNGFFNESKAKKTRRRKHWENEKKEAESIDLNALQDEIMANQEKRLKGFFNMISSIEEKAKGAKKRKQITNSAGKSTPPKKRRSKK